MVNRGPSETSWSLFVRRILALVLAPPLILVAFSSCKGSSGSGPASGCSQFFGTATGANSIALGQGSAYFSTSNMDVLAQGFTPYSTEALTSAAVYLQASLTGTDTLNGSVVLSVEADNSGMPDGAPIDTSSTRPVVSASSPNFYTFQFSGQAQLQSGQPYWLVLSHTYADNGQDYVIWYGGMATSSGNEGSSGTSGTFGGGTSGSFGTTGSSGTTSGNGSVPAMYSDSAQTFWQQATDSSGSTLALYYQVGC